MPDNFFVEDRLTNRHLYVFATITANSVNQDHSFSAISSQIWNNCLLSAFLKNLLYMNIRIGNGYDIHCLVPERPLILGGVHIPHELGLLGHSDADVLTHAIMDAMLGALSLGDIGLYFPPTDPKWKGADSLVLLAQVNQLILDKGWEIGNIDSVVVAERPKLKPHIEQMRDRLSTVLQLKPDQIGIKATTNEKLGPVGREEGIAAYAVVLVSKN